MYWAILCCAVPYRTRTVPHRTVPPAELADLQPATAGAAAATFDCDYEARPDEGVSDYKEGCSRPESAQGKLLHTLGILRRPLPNFAKLHCLQQPQGDKERTLCFLSFATPCPRHDTAQRTHHILLTHIDTHTSATPLHPQPSIDWSPQFFWIAPILTLGACSITLSCATKCGGIQLHSPRLV